MRLPMVAPVRPRMVSTKERKGKEKHRLQIILWSFYSSDSQPVLLVPLGGNSAVVRAYVIIINKQILAKT